MAKKTYQEKLAVRLNRATLDRIIIALATNSQNKKFAKNVINLFNVADMSPYLEDIQKFIRVELIKRIAQTISILNISDITMLQAIINLDGKYEDEMTKIFNELIQYELTPEENAIIDKLVINQLKYGIIKNNARKMIDTLVEIDTESFNDDVEQVLKKTENELGLIYRDLRKVQESLSASRHDLSLDVNSMRSTAPKYINEKKEPGYKIKTGVKDLNLMLNGGFTKGRLYCFYAPKKSFKSGTMLNCCIWAKKYNSFDVSDGKRPVIVYLSLENTTIQSLDRLWAYYNGKSDVTKYTAEEYIEKLTEVGLLSKHETETKIDLLYREDMSISTEDISKIIDDYEDRGEKVVFMAIDYIGRLRSMDNTVMMSGNEYNILAAVTNELVDIAREKNIPILTAAQLNRSAMEPIDKAGDRLEDKLKASTKSTSSSIQGSFKVTQNVDFGIVLHLIKNEQILSEKEILDGVMPKKDFYIYFKMTECRDEEPPITQFFVPFVENNSMRIAEDVNLKNKKFSFQIKDLNSDEMLTEEHLRRSPIISGASAKAKPIIIG